MKTRQFLMFPLRASAVFLALIAAGSGGCPCCGQAMCPTGGAFAALSSALSLLLALISMRRKPDQAKGETRR